MSASRLRPCDCNLCKRLHEPIQYRVIARHIKTYGKFENDLSELSSPPSSPHSHRSRPEPIDFDTDSNSRFDLYTAVNEVTRQAPNPDEQQHLRFDLFSTIQDGVPNDQNKPLDVPLSDQTSSFSDHTAESSFSDISEDSECEEIEISDDDIEDIDGNDKSFWTYSYDLTVYDSDITKTKVPNTNISLLTWLCLQIHLLVSHPTMSKSAFTHSLQVQKLIHSDTDNILPASYSEVRKLIDPFLIKKKVFHVCPNECVIFRDSLKYTYAHLEKCPICNEDRYTVTASKRQIPRRKFIYIPIGPRLARLYGDVNLCNMVQSHPGCEFDGEDMWDVHHSPSWTEIYSEEGFFQGDKRGISFALELDGVNPFHNIGIQYSMMPIMLTMLNLPRNIRNSFGNINLVGIIPGQGKTESTNVDPYLEILVDELLFLSKCTMHTYDNAPVQVKIKLLMYVLDYPGLCKVFHQTGSGSLSGCHWCHILGKRCGHLDKVVYLSNRRYLDKSDPLRKDEIHFVDKSAEFGDKPKLRNLDSESHYRKAYTNSKNKTSAATVASATGCKTSYVLSNLPGHDRLCESQPDACHTIKDVVQNVMNLVVGNKVNVQKIFNSEEKRNRFHLLNRSTEDKQDSEIKIPRNSDQKSRKRKMNDKVCSKGNGSEIHVGVSARKRQKTPGICLPYMLTAEELELADRRAEKVRFPVGFGLKSTPFISRSGSLKSHDWKQLACEGILKYCLRGTLEEKCRSTLFLLFDSISEICQEKLTLDKIDEIEVMLNKSLVLLEMYFPVHLQNITTHLLHHIPDGLRRTGPVYSSWMFVFERFNSWICKRVQNMRYPEATAVETFLLHDWCNFMFQSKRVSLNMTSTLASAGCLTQEDSEPDLHNCTALDESDSVHENHVKRKVCKLKKRQMNSIHKLLNSQRVCSSCNVYKYHYHKETHRVTKRVVTYTGCEKESVNAITVSSYVCVECSRGPQSQKVLSGKFVKFGRIQNFILHSTNNNEDSLACVNWIHNVTFDEESGLWFVRQNDHDQKLNKFSFILTKRLSPPLVTAEEDGNLWFLNSDKKLFKRNMSQ